MITTHFWPDNYKSPVSVVRANTNNILSEQFAAGILNHPGKNMLEFIFMRFINTPHLNCDKTNNVQLTGQKKTKT